jgi:hypothetical protein
MIEIVQNGFTRFGGPTRPVLSRIDRIYCSMPAWALAQVKANGSTAWQVEAKGHWETSDHSPVPASMSARRPLAKHLRPIPKWLAKHPTYIKNVKVLLDNAELEMMQPFQRLAFVKKQLRDASSLALKEIMNKPTTSKPARLQVLIICGRAIWYNQT